MQNQNTDSDTYIQKLSRFSLSFKKDVPLHPGLKRGPEQEEMP